MIASVHSVSGGRDISSRVMVGRTNLPLDSTEAEQIQKRSRGASGMGSRRAGISSKSIA